jgi:hypothetical protein
VPNASVPGSRAAVTALLEARLAAGEDIDIGDHALLCSSLVRIGQRMGWERVPRDVTASWRTWKSDKREATDVEID